MPESDIISRYRSVSVAHAVAPVTFVQPQNQVNQMPVGKEAESDGLEMVLNENSN